MGLKNVLSKLKLVELDTPPARPSAGVGSISPTLPAAPSRPAAPASATRMADILASVPEPEIDAKILEKAGGGSEAAGPAGELEIPDFESIFRAAGIGDPPHGFSAYKVLEILSSPELASLDPKSKAAALAGFLKMNPAGPVPIADVIQDAVRRDQALDKFAELLRGKLAGRAEQVERENARLQAEIDELTRRNQELMETNRRALEAEQGRLSQWLTRKRIEERRLADAVSPFVEGSPISIDGVDAPPSPAPSAPPATPGTGTDS